MQSCTWTRPGCLALVAVALLAAGLYAPGTPAQTPTAEQIEIFQNLPPDQQQAILEAIGSSGESRGTTGASDRSEQDEDAAAEARARARAARDERERTPSGEIRLRPDDTLIVEILPLEWEGQERVMTVRSMVSAPTLLPGLTTGSSQTPATPAEPGPQTAPRPADAQPIERTEAENANLERLIDTVRRGNPYRVTRSGTLDLPGLSPIPWPG